MKTRKKRDQGAAKHFREMALAAHNLEAFRSEALAQPVVDGGPAIRTPSAPSSLCITNIDTNKRVITYGPPSSTQTSVSPAAVQRPKWVAGDWCPLELPEKPK